ncbi:DUF4375 domain-containing protein [Flavobacterium sp. KACC 22758]|uniref:DMP19 family protein n=1 Tax=Flavobacterium sp. KACC 22758 TaxID=3025667 RepID=UPI002365B29C|nr:DUF4375 domain-containing protein [Flavobacterium sp. KACC 22758]WDF60556.1 DUF4375 domain-containing protein [Flavobacterium sp. KACC 22758]
MRHTLIIMGFFTAILSFFGCSGQTKKENGEIIVTVMEEKKIETSKDKVNMYLTEENIDRTSDKYLLDEVSTVFSTQLSGQHHNEYEVVTSSWNKSKQAVYMVRLLRGEVNNGGYNQFYNNAGGMYYKHLPEALHLIGAHKFADLTKRANETFEKEYERVTKYQEKFVDDPLEEFDDEFFDLNKTKNLEKLLVDYIRKHKKELVD